MRNYPGGNIIGVRMLSEESDGSYYIKYEFTDDNWREHALRILPYFIGQSENKFQTLHSFSTSYNLYTGETIEPTNIWLDNPYFNIMLLYK
jgi:hypothetical protein